MPQLSLYLNEEAMDTLQKDASAAKLSLSGYTRKVLYERQSSHGWPKGFFDLYGSLGEDDIVEPPELAWSDDGPRPWDD